MMMIVTFTVVASSPTSSSSRDGGEGGGREMGANRSTKTFATTCARTTKTGCAPHRVSFFCGFLPVSPKSLTQKIMNSFGAFFGHKQAEEEEEIIYNKQKWIIIGSAHKTMMMMTMSFNTTTTASCSQQLASSQKTSVRGGRANNKLRAQKHAIARQNGRRASSLVVCDGTGKFVVGGNWKCNGTIDSIDKLCASLNSGKITADVEVICAPPMVYIDRVQSKLKAPYQIAAQNCWVSKGGAFTGEVSAEMLKDANIPWVILGHSERRSLCGETNEFVGLKTKYALDTGVKVVACIGESLAQREAGDTLNVCFAQLKAIVDCVTEKDWENIIIAYEPVWAIGTGKVATPDQAQEVHAGVRKWMNENVSADVASKVRIQYGGSVNAGNCDELATKPDIDGFLVGGASLDGEAFVKICNSAAHSK